MTIGIYAIRRADTDEFYVGQSVNIEARWKGHLKSLRNGDHPAKYMQRVFTKHGASVFRFLVLQVVADPSRLSHAEQSWMDVLKPVYNNRPVASSNRGVKFSDEARANISAAQKRRFENPDERAKVGAPKRGRASPLKGKKRQYAPDVIAKIVAANSGRPSPMNGKQFHHSPEILAKLSAARKGKPSPIRGRASPFKGVPKSQWQLLAGHERRF